MIGTLSKYPKLATIYKKTEKSFLSRMEEFDIIFQTDQSSVKKKSNIESKFWSHSYFNINNHDLTETISQIQFSRDFLKVSNKIASCL